MKNTVITVIQTTLNNNLEHLLYDDNIIIQAQYRHRTVIVPIGESYFKLLKLT